jgi:Flp pilus assembly protein TadD
LGNYRSAAVYLRALLKERPKDTRLLIEYCGCIERAGGSGYARLILEKAAAYFENSSDISIALGLLAFREGQLEKSFDYLREASSRDKKDPRPYRWMHLIAKKKGDLQGAERFEREYRRILKNSATKTNSK